MEPWVIGLALTMAIGVAVILFGGLWDRDRNERRRRELEAPPRPIPNFSPDQPQPHYLSDLEAARRPEDAPDWTLAPETAARLQRRLYQDSGYATELLADEFITQQASGWAAARDPLILVTHAELSAIRELLPTLEHAVVSGHPLVIVCAGYGPEVGRTLAVNQVQGKLQLVPLTASADVRRQIAQATGATEASLADLRSDSVAEAQLGRAGWWIATADRSWPLADTGGSEIDS